MGLVISQVGRQFATSTGKKRQPYSGQYGIDCRPDCQGQNGRPGVPSAPVAQPP